MIFPLLAGLLALVSEATAIAPPEFTDAQITSAEGYATVRWSWPSEEPQDRFQVALAEPDGERIAYEGPNHQFFLSGLPEGDYELRVRHRLGDEGSWGGWSSPLALVVRHHSLGMALSLFAVGGLMFLWIIVFLVRNVAATRRPIA